MKCNKSWKLWNCSSKSKLVSLLVSIAAAIPCEEVILIFRVEQRTFFSNEGYWCGSHNCSVLSLYFAIYKWFRLGPTLKITNGKKLALLILQSRWLVSISSRPAKVFLQLRKYFKFVFRLFEYICIFFYFNCYFAFNIDARVW